MANFGIGFGAFAQGLAGGISQGAQLGKALRGIKNNNIREDMVKEAKTEHDAKIADDVLTKAGKADPNEAFDAEAAAKESRKQNSFTNFLYTQKMPEMVDAMVRAGDLDGAKALQEWGADEKQRQQMENYGQLLNFGMLGQGTGDYTKFADHAVSLVNNGKYGIKADGYKFVKDGDGNTTGITFDLTQDGKKFSHTFNSTDEAVQFFADQGSPQNAFKRWQDEKEQARKLKATAYGEQVKANIALGKGISLENHKQMGRERLAGITHDNDMRRDAAKARGNTSAAAQNANFRINALKQANYSDEWINENMPLILGMDPNRKGASVEETVRLTRQQLMQSDPEFPDLSPEEQDARIMEIVQANQIIAGRLQPKPQGAAISSPAKPALSVFR